MPTRSLLDTAWKVVATALSQSPLTRTLVGPWRTEETGGVEFAQAHLALYDREPSLRL